MEQSISRSALHSPRSSVPSSPDAAQMRLWDELGGAMEFISCETRALDEREGGDEDEALDFQLFATRQGTSVQGDSLAINKIRLHSPTQETTDKSGFVSKRGLNFYLTEQPTPEQREQFKEAAISGQAVMQYAHKKCPGQAYEWRVLHLPQSGETRLARATCSGAFGGFANIGEKQKRSRPGKKTRIKSRIKRQSVQQQALFQAKAQEAKEIAEREKRAQRNREKKMKRRDRERAKKSAARENNADQPEGEDNQHVSDQ